MQARRRAALAAVAAMGATMLGAGAAGAATVTFEGGTHLSGIPPVGTYVEDGVTVTPGGPFDLVTGHLDDGGSSYAWELTFTMAGPFDALSFDLVPDESFAAACDIFDDCVPYAFENVAVSGYAGGTLVASDTFDMFALAGPYTFGSAFSGLDSLVIGFADYPFGTTFPDGTTFQCMGAPPCTHFTIDNVTLAPVAAVPLPAGAALLVSALVLLVHRRRR